MCVSVFIYFICMLVCTFWAISLTKRNQINNIQQENQQNTSMKHTLIQIYVQFLVFFFIRCTYSHFVLLLKVIVIDVVVGIAVAATSPVWYMW